MSTSTAVEPPSTIIIAPVTHDASSVADRRGDLPRASAPVGDDPPEAWDATLRINLTGPFLLARAAIPHLMVRA
jgi:NAD(P)-dependent dehydrogenase (short-subunit alcohol dehydrogenase family)